MRNFLFHHFFSVSITEMLQSLKLKRKIKISFFIWELHIFWEIDYFFTLIEADENNHWFIFSKNNFSAWNWLELCFLRIRNMEYCPISIIFRTFLSSCAMPISSNGYYAPINIFAWNLLRDIKRTSMWNTHHTHVHTCRGKCLDLCNIIILHFASCLFPRAENQL